MTTHLAIPSKRLLATAGATLAVLGGSAAAASAATPDEDVPAAGATVICDATGALTGTSGYLRQREQTWLDVRGRAHVLFTIHARQVELGAADGTRYRLLGNGYDRVTYPGSNVTGDVQSEDEAFDFTVVGPGGIAGVVRFRLHISASQPPRVHDTSTCQLPNMS